MKEGRKEKEGRLVGWVQISWLIVYDDAGNEGFG
jgi:hypothetical protein